MLRTQNLTSLGDSRIGTISLETTVARAQVHCRLRAPVVVQQVVEDATDSPRLAVALQVLSLTSTQRMNQAFPWWTVKPLLYAVVVLQQEVGHLLAVPPVLQHEADPRGAVVGSLQAEAVDSAVQEGAGEIGRRYVYIGFGPVVYA